MSSYYFDASTLDPAALVAHLKSSSSSNLEAFISAFSRVKPLFTGLRQGDQLDLLLQLVDYMGKALVKASDKAAQREIQAEAERGKLMKML